MIPKRTDSENPQVAKTELERPTPTPAGWRRPWGGCLRYPPREPPQSPAWVQDTSEFTMPIDLQLKPMLDAANAPGNPGMETLDVASAREVALQMVAAMAGARTEVASVENRTIPGPQGEIPVRIYTPEGEGRKGVLVFFHGSGFVIFNLDSHDAECRALAQRAGVIVVSVDYRLAP